MPAEKGEQTQGLVLVIDDEPALRRICRRALEGVGYTVIEAADGLAGLAQFHERSAEVRAIVLDLTMPGIGGAEVLARIRQTHAAVPVIIASGYDKSSGATSIPEDAHVSYLQKPFELETLRRNVRDAIG